MEKHLGHLPLVMKFSLLCELLPFYGHLPLWRYLLCSLSSQTRQVWNKYQHAFREISKNMRMSVVEYKGAFDYQFKEFLSDPEVLLNNKISVFLDSTQEWLGLFGEFLTNLLHSNKRPVFDRISYLEKSICVSCFAEPLYDLLKAMGDNQEKAFLKRWNILSWRHTDIDPFTKQPISELIDTEYVK